MLKEFAINLTIVSLVSQGGKLGQRPHGAGQGHVVTGPPQSHSGSRSLLLVPHHAACSKPSMEGDQRLGWVGHTGDRKEVKTEAKRNPSLAKVCSLGLSGAQISAIDADHPWRTFKRYTDLLTSYP